MMQPEAPINKPSLSRRFLQHILHMPAWHRWVLLGAIAFGVIGTIGRVRQFTAPTPAPQSVSKGGVMSTPHSGFADTDSAPDATATTTTPVPWYLSPRFLSIGGSVLSGFLIGWAMRVFVKTTLLVGLAISAVIGGLSYFHVMNVDLTSVQQKYNGDVSWLTDQASRLKDVAIAHIPVHAGGLFGMFMGFRRPRL
jgi:uncharacterized membrane protein (Fun14 family)